MPVVDSGGECSSGVSDSNVVATNAGVRRAGGAGTGLFRLFLFSRADREHRMRPL